MQLKIAARNSDLAKIQAYMVGDILKKNGHSVSFQFKASTGDIEQRRDLRSFSEKGVFTQDFVQDLELNICDMVIHSFKDLPTEPRKSTEIVATLQRADVRDVLLFSKNKIEAKKNKLKIFTSSPRRIYNLEKFIYSIIPWNLNSVEYLPVRGNILTRFKKIFLADSNESADGIVIAKAALDRILSNPYKEFDDSKKELLQLLELTQWMVLPVFQNPSAAAQGALAIEIKKNREDLKNILKNINNFESWQSVAWEREKLSSLGGGCHQKIGLNSLNTKFGEIQISKGHADSGEILNEINFIPQKKLTIKPKLNEICFDLLQDNFFKREPLDNDSIQLDNIYNNSKKLWWISRFEAYENFKQKNKINQNSILWTSGFKTWQKLAKKGLWVNGCSEGLGEGEGLNIDYLIQKPIEVIFKLTHEHGLTGFKNFYFDNAEIINISTYKLIEKKIDLKSLSSIVNKKYFFWSSGSCFKSAIKAFPEIKNATHFCGPGNTYDVLKTELKSDKNLFIDLDFQTWKKRWS